MEARWQAMPKLAGESRRWLTPPRPRLVHVVAPAAAAAARRLPVDACWLTSEPGAPVTVAAAGAEADAPAAAAVASGGHARLLRCCAGLILPLLVDVCWLTPATRCLPMEPC